ncbi:MAG: hypothetical protein EOP34_02055 [Rickettsiales bacterium]|nr:MAG: hypothetical protein EOP34_02055 [Rickettsiales bacterium]
MHSRCCSCLYVLPWGQMSFWGEINCPTCIALYSILSSSILSVKISTMLIPFNKPSTKSVKRIGPHNKDVYSIIFGSLLGDGYAEKRAGGTRIQFAQENSHGAYALWLAQRLADAGYRSTQPLEISTRLGVGGKVRFLYRFRTYTFSSFNVFYEMFYCQRTLYLQPNTVTAENIYLKNRKIVPSLTDLKLYLTPLALAIWIMDDGTQSGKGLKLCTNCFTKTEVQTLCDVLGEIYNLKATVNSAGVEHQYVIYISSHSMCLLKEIVETHMEPSMKYKLGY